MSPSTLSDSLGQILACELSCQLFCTCLTLEPGGWKRQISQKGLQKVSPNRQAIDYYRVSMASNEAPKKQHGAGN